MNSIALAMVLLLALGLVFGCTYDENKQVDPEAFSMWILPW